MYSYGYPVYPSYQNNNDGMGSWWAIFIIILIQHVIGVFDGFPNFFNVVIILPKAATFNCLHLYNESPYFNNLT